MRNRLWLVKNGVPYDVAFKLPREDVDAYGIIFYEMADERNRFDWATMRWEKRE